MSLRSRVAILAAAVALGVGVAAAATDLVAVRKAAEDVSRRRQELQRAGRLDPAADRRLIEELAPLVLSFVAESDRAARTANEAGARRRLAPVFEPLHRTVAAIYRHWSGESERMAQKVMEADGDLEALYESRPFQEAQLTAARALYYLNWLAYYGARLHEGKRRRELLEAAARGFSEFAVGDNPPELVSESLLGRALCHIELGNHDWAIRDLQLVLKQENLSPERRNKARLALLDAYTRAGKTAEVLRLSEELLAPGAVPRADRPIVQLYRLTALLDAADAARGAAGDRYRDQATRLGEQLRRAGKGWARRVESILASRIDDPEEWVGRARTPETRLRVAKLFFQRGSPERAAPLLEAVLRDPQATRYHGEAHYLLGLIHFRAEEYTKAAGELGAALQTPDDEWAADAAYMRFKAVEAEVASDPNTPLLAQYEPAMAFFLERFPDHSSAAEVRYRLGELLQSRGDCERAAEQYRQVSGDPGFEIRARFALVQCGFEELGRARDRGARDTALRRIAGALQEFRAAADSLPEGAAAEVDLDGLRARVAILSAVHAALSSPNDGNQRMLDILSGFETRFPGRPELLAQVTRMRLRAYHALGRHAEAAEEAARHADALRAEGRTDALEKLAADFARAAQRSESGKDAAARAAARLYEILAELGSADDRARLTLARLYLQEGEVDRAEAIYRQTLARVPNSLNALRGLAEVAERRGRGSEALSYWKRYTELARPGDRAWFAGHYQQARLLLARGDRDAACELLRSLRPAMPGLADSTLRERLGALWKSGCD